MTTETTRGVNKDIVMAVSVVSLLVCGAVPIVVLFWLRKRRAGNEITTETIRGVDKVTTETIGGVDKAISIAVLGVLVVCGVVLIVVLFWLRKCRAGNGETQNSKEACELVVLPIVTVGEWEQKEKPMEKIGLWGTKPLTGTNGIHNGHNERLENCKLL